MPSLDYETYKEGAPKVPLSLTGLVDWKFEHSTSASRATSESGQAQEWLNMYGDPEEGPKMYLDRTMGTTGSTYRIKTAKHKVLQNGRQIITYEDFKLTKDTGLVEATTGERVSAFKQVVLYARLARLHSV